MNSLSSNSDRNKKQGDRFEELAAEYFEKSQFKVLEKNYRSGHKEIDLIVTKENLIVFVEVKSTYSKKFGHPASWVDRKKQKNIYETALAYIQENEINNRDLRFDVITFVNGVLEHYPDAFQIEHL